MTARDAIGRLFEPGDRPRWQADLLLIAKIVLVIYAVFVVFGLVLGLSVNGVVSTLRRVTFFAAVYALLTLALNLHWGYTGLFNIGVAGFMAVGVYSMAILTASPDASPGGFGLPLWVGVLGGMAAAAVVGLIAALPALRLRADYFAIVTLGFSEIVRLSLLSASLREFEVAGRELGTGGGSGITFTGTQSIVDWLFYPGGDRRADPTVVGEFLFGVGDLLGVQSTVVRSGMYTVLLLVCVVALYALLSRIAYSPFGRVLKAIREDELAARSLGKPTDRVKIKVFMLGCALMGLAGMLWQGGRGFVTPESFMPILTFYVFVALIVGGSGSNTGSVIGGFVFAAALWEGPPFVQRIVRANLDARAPPTIYDAAVELGSLDPLPLLGYAVGNVDQLRFMIVGLVLILLMLWRPDGLLGHRTETAAATDLSKRPTTAAAADGGETDE
ncbi:branched-chain amino acid ABC transporter permease [Halalkalicoccus sp. NIPERK01]|uniref:branched-chain amino acid ABC transporter permease n=1 Tax=Halalkalicoccus sp. NIPERK01 TaxID=3053469 RepID=UPI00256EB741|nr:branched-chain amino acid ABC transporter permease [Halalkalicoccus sp. NIPERK01]MDL5361448.1 branched-chain amino acid ABC transporter permease [Halalkalicoccus sp. NIPERK01]